MSPVKPKIWLEEPKEEDLTYFYVEKPKVNLRPTRDFFL